MVVNESRLERILSVVVATGLVVLVLAGVLSMTWAVIAGIVAALLLVTGVLGWCPFYAAPHKSSTGAAPRA